MWTEQAIRKALDGHYWYITTDGHVADRGSSHAPKPQGAPRDTMLNTPRYRHPQKAAPGRIPWQPEMMETVRTMFDAGATAKAIALTLNVSINIVYQRIAVHRYEMRGMPRKVEKPAKAKPFKTVKTWDPVTMKQPLEEMMDDGLTCKAISQAIGLSYDQTYYQMHRRNWRAYNVKKKEGKALP